MPKRIYQVGEPCDDCGTPAVEGRNGAYCKACYIKWKNANPTQPKPQQAYIPKQTSTRDFEAETLGKVRHGLICAFIQGKSVKEITEQFSDFKVKLLMPLEQLVMGKPKAEPRAVAPELPTINVDEEIDVNEIDFEEPFK